MPAASIGRSVDSNAGTLTMYGVDVIGNAETVDITVPLPADGQYGPSQLDDDHLRQRRHRFAREGGKRSSRGAREQRMPQR
jgi:hypothetical protein